MIIRSVVGKSMMPTLKERQIVLARKRFPKIGDIVIARVEGMEVVKRIKNLSPRLVLGGDNPNSAVYEDVKESDIVGVVIWPKTK